MRKTRSRTNAPARLTAAVVALAITTPLHAQAADPAAHLNDLRIEVAPDMSHFDGSSAHGIRLVCKSPKPSTRMGQAALRALPAIGQVST